MAANANQERRIVVTGDVTIDWNLARGRGSVGGGPIWSPDLCSRATWQRGGAALIADLVEAVATQVRGTANYRVLQPEVPGRSGGSDTDAVGPEDPRFPHSYASWLEYEFGKSKRHEKERNAWRVQEFLGIQHCGRQGAQDWARVVNDVADPQIVVLDDANLGFRSCRELWPAGITKPEGDPWILVKMARPGAQGDLWEHLHREHWKKLIVVMTVEDLRLSDVQISRELSWERTAQDLAWEVTYNPSVNSLAHCAHLVVSFNAAGAILYSRGRKDTSAELAFAFRPKRDRGGMGTNL